MQSLQAKIFVLFVGLLVCVQSIAIFTIYRATEERSQASINTRLTNATTLFKSLFQSNSEKLVAIAEAAALDGGLRESFYEDQRSFLVALNNHRKRIKADIAFAIDDKQIIKAQLIKTTQANQKTKVSRGPEIDQPFSQPDWLLFPQLERLYRIDNSLYQMNFASVKSGSEVIGWIGFGFVVDQFLANNFEDLTDLTTDFILHGQTDSTFIASSKSSERRIDVDLSEESKIYSLENTIATVIHIGEINSDSQESLKVVLHGSRADLLDSIETQWLQFLGLAGITLVLSLTGAYFIAMSISKPVKQLVSWAKFIAKGNYDEPVSITDKGELGQLAKEFSVMQKEVLSRELLISHRAYHDPLTELPNRIKLLEELESISSDQSNSFVLYLINVSHINDINSSLGHAFGDSVIIEFAKRLSTINSRPELFHIGADEFVLLFNNATTDSVESWGTAIDSALTTPFVNASMTFNLRSRAGIACFPEHSLDPEELIQKANTAMKYCKQQRLQYSIYDASQDVDTLEQLSLMNDLSVAIKESQLRLYYQPKVTLDCELTETVEALVRWQHPKLGMIPPDKFISIAEKTGLINPLTDWVIAEAVRQYAAWRTKGIDLMIAVNISAENLKASDFYDSVCQKIEDANIPMESIMLEVTESAVVDNPAEAIELLQRFRDRGFKLSIDDYGTGYSSLAQLKDLPVDELKIDMSFVKKLPNDEGDKIIVRSTIELAHNMGLTVVAEGVENGDAMAWLKEKGCERAQGYHISRPVPASELESWLQHTPFYNWC